MPPPSRPQLFERIAERLTAWTGSSIAFLLAVSTIAIWIVSGPLFGYSDTWQLVINTGTTIVTFLMVFLIQRAQNKDSRAIQLKLNEIVAALEGASNRLINAENFSEQEIDVLHGHYCELAKLAQKDAKITESHSVEEAHRRAEEKGSRHHSKRTKRD